MTDVTAPVLPGQWVRRTTARGTATGILGAGLLATGIIWRYPGVLMLGGALLILAATAVVSILRRAPVRVQRRVWPLEVTRFEPCQASLRISRSRGLLPLSIDTTEHIGGLAVPVWMPPLPGGRAAEVTYPIPTAKRGMYTIGPLDVHRRALAGLAENRAALGRTITVRVLPRVLPVSGLPGGVRRHHIGTEERVPHGGTDLVGLRDYLAGDDLRRLHWATSGRTGKLMVREDADPSSSHLTLLLDDRAGSYPDRDMEDAVEVAASLAVAAAGEQHGIRLATVCEQVERTLLATPGIPIDARDIVSALAEVTARDGDATPAPLPVSELDIVVVVTGAAADLGPLVTEAGRAALGVVAVVDTAPSAGDTVVTAGSVTVLRGRHAAELLARWDGAVVSG